MIDITCPKCEKEFSVNIENEGIIFLPIFDKCECGEEYCLTTDCDDEYDSIIIAEFYN